LDDRTKKDETWHIVSILPDYAESDPNAPAMAGVGLLVAVEVLTPVDVRSHRLNEGTSKEGKVREKFFILRRERLSLWDRSSIWGALRSKWRTLK
jgi:hypothetical protein